MRLTRWMHIKKFPLKNIALSTRPHRSMLMPPVDFKQCCSLLDGNKLRWKVESSSSEAKIVLIGAESLKIFPR